MMYEVESFSCPNVIDDKTSKKWVYVRQNIKETERNVGGIITKVYTFEEEKIPKSVFSIFQKEQTNSKRLNDIENAIAELIGGDGT